jgi:hypothetical protein
MRLRRPFALLLLALAASATARAQDDIRTTFGDGRGSGGVAQGTELRRHTVDQQLFPLARCNDNSPAIFYYRPASRPADADKWLIHLQGGGSCGGGLSCSERWFSVNTRFGSNNMTSAGFPDGTTAPGIFDRANPQNPFGTFNQVFVHYCSSDMWSGTAENRVLTGLDFGPLLEGRGLPCPTQYTISFLGRRIFEAVVATLRRDGVPALEFDGPRGASRPMPDLDAATRVVLSGGSGGGYGVINNLDHLRASLPDGARLVGLTDSAFPPSKRHMDLSRTRLCVTQGHCTVEAQNRWDYEEGPFHVWGSAGGGDASCLTHHSADPHQCADSGHVLTDHVTTPYFVRMDLLDPLALDGYQDDNLFVAGTPDPEPDTPEHEPLGERQFAAATLADVLALALSRRTAHEGAAMPLAPGAFAPACRQHDVLRSDGGVYDTAIRWRGRELKMFQVFEAWLDGRRPATLAAVGKDDSACP